MIGLEAGQSAFGDVYAWFRGVLEWPLKELVGKSDLLDAETKEKLIEEASEAIIPELTKEAENVPVGESTILATDWMNGRRTPDANQMVKGTITGLTLGSSAPLIFRALVEATAYGSKAIVDRFLENGIEIKEIVDRWYLVEIALRDADDVRRVVCRLRWRKLSSRVPLVPPCSPPWWRVCTVKWKRPKARWAIRL